MHKFATVILVAPLSGVSTSAICHFGQRLFPRSAPPPQKSVQTLYVLHIWNRSTGNEQGQA